MIFRRSENVPPLDDCRGYRDPYLRPDFQYRCAYCLTPELYFLNGDAGEIDHFRPLNPRPELGLDFSHLRNVYRNLYWTCGRCNLHKGNTWPTLDDTEQGRRLVDPCVEDHDSHFRLQSDGTLQPTSVVGEYTIGVIRLNRRNLVTIRKYLIRWDSMLSMLRSSLGHEIPIATQEVILSQITSLQELLHSGGPDE
jgi:hypothetical protein